jgi:hypothetical protein
MNIKNMLNESNFMLNQLIELKAKYVKRTGSPGNYKYYYTQDELRQAGLGSSNNKEKKFGNFKEIDLDGKENHKISRFTNTFMLNKGLSGLTKYTEEKINILSNALKREGHKKIDYKDFEGSYNLKEIYENKDFYKKYPSMSEINLFFINFKTDKKRGVVIGDDIYINSKLYKKDKDMLRSTIVHELQHKKQDIRKWEKLPENATYKEKYESLREIDARKKQEQFLQELKLNN